MAQPVPTRPKIERQPRRGFSGDPAALAAFEPAGIPGALPALCRPRLPGVNLASWAAARRDERLGQAGLQQQGAARRRR